MPSAWGSAGYWDEWYAAQLQVYGNFFGFAPSPGEWSWPVRTPFGQLDRIGSSVILDDDPTPGRRLRVLSAMILGQPSGIFASWVESPYEHLLLSDNRDQSYLSLYEHVGENHREPFQRLRLRNIANADTPPMIDSIQPKPGNRNPDLAYCLQDLGYEIGEDVRDACEALRDPDLYYPGIDEGIEPVPDDHVELVIWALQRELDRELRPSTVAAKVLPSPPLMDLPWRIKRALAERRRYRYLQYGIGREQWETGWWSLWGVREDPDWVPRRQMRLAVTS